MLRIITVSIELFYKFMYGHECTERISTYFQNNLLNIVMENVFCDVKKLTNVNTVKT